MCVDSNARKRFGVSLRFKKLCGAKKNSVLNFSCCPRENADVFQQVADLVETDPNGQIEEPK